MHPSLAPWFGIVLLLAWAPAATAAFRAGAFVTDISPPTVPVRVNAMFTERSATNVVDPLLAKALALDDGQTRVVLCLVDSCMVPRELVDRAKSEASQTTGLPAHRMLVAATHTHSAPSAMGCLGSRVDPAYAAWLPARISAAMVGAVGRLAPARVAWAQADDWEHTFNRRWIRRPDRLLTDPFGQQNVRAHMHPGYQSPDVVGPSGPVDPQLSVIAVQSQEGQPLAVLANYSMHYYGSPLLSSDYFGRFAQHLAIELRAGGDFVAIMSQGTSGDLMWMDYSAPSRDIGYDAYAQALATKVASLVQQMRWQDTAPIRMAESKLDLSYRIPDADRLSWARQITAQLEGRLPRSHPEIYALEATYLHEKPRTELVLQAVRIGELGIAALPNEVFALTGLKLKQRSPLPVTFTIELANGAEGYIPPPEQHQLGGYTTWPARTAGLAVEAEPRLVEASLTLLEEVAGRPRRPPPVEHGPYAKAILEAKPLAYWRLEEMEWPTARNSAADRFHATFEKGTALFLPGADARIGFQPSQPPELNAFSGKQINRAVHFAGGRLRASVPLGADYTVELWFWNGLPADARPVTGSIFSRGESEQLEISGTSQGDAAGKLLLSTPVAAAPALIGRTPIPWRTWHHVAFVRAGNQVRVHLDGRPDPEMEGPLPAPSAATESLLFLGGRSDGQFSFEGKLDEAAVYDRALSAAEIRAHYQTAGFGR